MARDAAFQEFQELALRRRVASNNDLSNLPLAVVSLETEQRDRALHELASFAERDYEQKRSRWELKEDERRAALIDIVRAIDRIPKSPGAGSESTVLAAIARELQSVLRATLPSVSRVELWVQDIVGVRCITAVEGATDQSHVDDPFLVDVLRSGEPVFPRDAPRHAVTSAIKTEQPRVGLPLVLGEQKLGAILIVGEGVSGLTREDRRYLELVAVQVSASVLTANLAGRMEQQTIVWAREQLAHHVLHSGGNAASNVSANSRELQRLLRDPRIHFRDDLDLDVEQVVADIIADAELVRRTLDTLRTEAVEETVFDLMVELRALAEEMASNSPASIRVDGPDSASVFGVKALINHALANVVQNAAQAAGESGANEMTVIISVNPHPAIASQWLVHIEDSGFGVSHHIAKQIWEVGTHFRSGGNGYGLPFARRTLEASGGGLDYAGISASLGGAHFCAWLPNMAMVGNEGDGEHTNSRGQ